MQDTPRLCHTTSQDSELEEALIGRDCGHIHFGKADVGDEKRWLTVGQGRSRARDQFSHFAGTDQYITRIWKIALTVVEVQSLWEGTKPQNQITVFKLNEPLLNDAALWACGYW